MVQLEQFFPEVTEGIVGSAFHGIIELGYGGELTDEGGEVLGNPLGPVKEEVMAAGLAYSTFSFLSLGEISAVIQRNFFHFQGPKRSADPKEILSQIRSDDSFDSFPLERKFMGRISAFCEPHWNAFLPHYDLEISLENSDVLSEFVELAAEVFSGTGANDFFLLHGLTSMRALKTTLLHLPKVPREQYESVVKKSLQVYWRGVVATYVAQGRPPLRPREQWEGPWESWDHMIAGVTAQDDEHLIKLAFVAQAEAKEHPHKEFFWRETLQRTISAISPGGVQSPLWIFRRDAKAAD